MSLALGQAWLTLPEERNVGKMLLFSQKGEVRSLADVRREEWECVEVKRERDLQRVGSVQ